MESLHKFAKHCVRYRVWTADPSLIFRRLVYGAACAVFSIFLFMVGGLLGTTLVQHWEFELFDACANYSKPKDPENGTIIDPRHSETAVLHRLRSELGSGNLSSCEQLLDWGPRVASSAVTATLLLFSFVAAVGLLCCLQRLCNFHRPPPRTQPPPYVPSKEASPKEPSLAEPTDTLLSPPLVESVSAILSRAKSAPPSMA